MSQATAGVLELYLAIEEARAERSRRVHLTALLSAPLFVAVWWPTLLSDVGRRAVLTFWAFSALSACWALALEWRLRLRST
ncbi:MAG: hypothetical protein Q8N23_16030 [Archangium sp.]|nr:hypothetical protein [Archangium sp.]MDP3154185.1 hypothetical protein [Archangium sp.]MDP3569524.1 hypothetical protein [Archangium sp.]